MKEPRTPATLRVPPRRQHPRLLLERDDVPIMRQTFSAEHRPFKLRRQAPAVARYSSYASLNLLDFVSKKIKRTPIEPKQHSSPATHNVTPTLVISEPVSQSESLPLVDTMHPIDKISPETPPNTPAVDSLPVTCPQVDSLPVSHPQVNSQQVNSPSPAPSPSDEQGMSAENELIIQRKTKSIRSRSDRVTWYHTYSRSTLSTPSTSPLLYSHELCRGDLRLHKSQQDGQIQTWVWDGLQWVGIEHGDPHLNLPGYRLKFVGEEPNWVTRKTVVDDIGRAKRVASTAPPLFVQGSVPSSALEDGSGRGLGSGFP
ncbi:hypothetical protein BD769DRAFT_1660538 [Suillus cothurnatus]|nr:hypothetical protein BD769DRAFT_1660538 [Suillus cothurnatus]